jgi:hypothetical protein
VGGGSSRSTSAGYRYDKRGSDREREKQGTGVREIQNGSMTRMRGSERWKRKQKTEGVGQVKP